MKKTGSHTNMEFLGEKLRRDIFNQYGALVIPAETVLDQEIIRVITSHNILITPKDVHSNLPQTKPLFDQTVKHVQDIFQEIRFSKKIPLSELRKHILPMIQQTTEQPDLFQLFASLQSKDDYTYRHNIGVGVIATMIGKWLNLEERELLQLTMAATLHDVGKMNIPLEILNKPGKLTQEEFALMKQHSIFGYHLIKETVGTTHRQALVALQHHERIDGSGYPIGIRRDQIDLFSRIVAVADVFHAMTSKRSYHEAASFYETLKQLQQSAFGALDPKITHVFIDKIMQSLVGNDVLLSDGNTGKIVLVPLNDPLRPLISTGNGFVDLSKESALHVEKVLVPDFFR